MADTARNTKRKDKLLTLARERARLVLEADKDQDARERADLSFYQGDGQWPSDVRRARDGIESKPGTPAVPARPCITINKTREPVRHVLNEERQADLGIEVVPADDFEALVGPIDPTEIELREGLLRRLQRQQFAADARTWAFSRAVISGRGYYGVLPQRIKGKTFDQEIVYRKFYDQSAVKLDPAHEQADGSDARWGFVLTWMEWDAYLDEYPFIGEDDNPLYDYRETDFSQLVADYPSWFRMSETSKVRMVLVVEYWYLETNTRWLVELADGRVLYEDELDLPKGAKKPAYKRRVQDGSVTVHFAKLDEYQIIEEATVPGEWIPIFKIIGEEFHPFDDQRRCEGMVRPVREPQFGFNVMISAEIEAIALAPKSRVIVDPRQIEPFEQMWLEMATRNWAYLPALAFDENGRPFPEIKLQQPSTDIQAMAVAITQFDMAIKSTSATPDATLGNVDPSVRSGRGIAALQRMAAQGNSHYMDNLVRTMHHEARVINGMLATVYDRPGRLLRITTGESEGKSVLLNVPQISGGPGQPPQKFDPTNPAMQGQTPVTYTLSKDATFNIAIKVSKNFDTQRMEEATTLGNLISAEPALMGVFGDLFFKYQDGPGHTEMAERAKVMLAPPVQQLLTQKAGGLPPAVQAQMQAMEGKLKQAEQALETDAAKQEAQLKAKQMDVDAKLQEAHLAADKELALQVMKNAVQIAVAHIAAAAKGADITAHAAEEAQALGHAGLQAAADQAHERLVASQQHVQALEQGQVAHGQAMAQQGVAAAQDAVAGEQAHQQGLEAGAEGHQQALEQAGQQHLQNLTEQAAAAEAEPAADAGAEA